MPIPYPYGICPSYPRIIQCKFTVARSCENSSTFMFTRNQTKLSPNLTRSTFPNLGLIFISPLYRSPPRKNRGSICVKPSDPAPQNTISKSKPFRGRIKMGCNFESALMWLNPLISWSLLFSQVWLHKLLIGCCRVFQAQALPNCSFQRGTVFSWGRKPMLQRSMDFNIDYIALHGVTGGNYCETQTSFVGVPGAIRRNEPTITAKCSVYESSYFFKKKKILKQC